MNIIFCLTGLLNNQLILYFTQKLEKRAWPTLNKIWNFSILDFNVQLHIEPPHVLRLIVGMRILSFQGYRGAFRRCEEAEAQFSFSKFTISPVLKMKAEDTNENLFAPPNSPSYTQISDQ